MIKKYSKIILLTLLLFFVFITTVNAKEVTLDELAQEVKEFEPNATYVYVIGEYAFTSTHILTTQDVMLAARSIEVSENSGSTNEDPIYNEMTIGYFECTYDDEWNINGLEYVTNLVGTTAAKEKYEINYIDHNEDINKVEVNALVEKAYNTVAEVANNEKFMVSMEEGDILVTILDGQMNSVEALKGTGLVKAAEELLNEEGVKSVTVGIAGTEAKVTVTAEDLMEKLGDLDELFAVLAGKEEATAKDLDTKSLEVTVELEEGYTTDDELPFTITFAVNEVPVADLFETAYNKVADIENDKFEVSLAEEEIIVKLLDAQMDSVEALKGLGLTEVAEDFLNEEGVKAVVLTIPGTTAKVEITAENLMEKAEELNELFVALAGKEDATAKDLANATLEVAVELEEGYITEDGTTFTVTFAIKEVVVNDLVETAYNKAEELVNDKFEVALGEDGLIVTLLDAQMDSVEALKGTGISKIAEELLNAEGVKSVVLTIPGTTAKVEITAENLMEKVEELNELFIALAGKENATAADLAGKTLEVAVELEEGYVAEGEATFTVAFEQKEIVVVSELVNNVYETIENATETSDKFEVAKTEDTITVTIVDTEMNSVFALGGTGISDAAEDLLNAEGVKSVTLAIPDTTAKIELTAENIMDNLGYIDELFVALAGSEDATAADLASKKLSVSIGLKDGYTTNNNTTFMIVFA